MGVKKIKGVRKDFGKTEVVLSSAERLKAWAENNTVFLTAAAAVVLLAFALSWGFRAYSEGKERNAQADYALIFAKWPAEDAESFKDWEKLIPDLEIFINNHQGTTAGVDAQLDLCRIYMQTRQHEEVEKWCGKVLNDAVAGQDLKSLARYQLALSYQAQGKTDEALSQWNALKGEGLGWLGREANWRVAKLHCQKKEYSKAVEEYELALKASGSYPSEALLQEELASARLKAGGEENQPKGEPPG